MVVGEPKRSIMEGIENTGDVRLHDHRLRLKQRFDIIRKLGQGTYGKVQLGINKKTGQEVAIKTIKKCKIETEADLVRIRREVQIMSSVRHPNIVHIYEVFENSEKMILVMEYCAGGELYDYLSQQKVLQEDEARRLFRQIATAVYYCHKHKICHRDLKLENVLLDEHGSAKIADFGLSNVFEERRLLSTFCGSPLYASPEIVKGTPYIGPEVDCWSLGVLLYTLVYGAMPFDGSNFKRLVKQISTGDYFEPKNPSSASPLIRDMLTVDPILRADITHICDHSWVNKGSDVSCLELAEALANETPVRLDLLLSLAPPPVHGSDKLVVTDEVTNTGTSGSPGRSISMANVDNSAERRILEMVAEGGTDAIKPSPTRTIVSAAEQPKRKLETTASMDSAPSPRKIEHILRSGSKVNQGPPQNDEGIVTVTENNCHPADIQRDVSMKNETKPIEKVKTPSPEPKVEESAKLEKSEEQSSPTTNNNISASEVVNNQTSTPSAVKTPVHTKKDPKADQKTRDSVLKEKNTPTKPSVGVKKKVFTFNSKNDDKKSVKAKEKSPPRKSLEKDAMAKKPSVEGDIVKADGESLKQPTERRKSRIMDASDKLNNLTIQPAPSSPPVVSPVSSPPLPKPKKVIIPGVSVGSFKEQFERRASLTSPSVNELKKPAAKAAQGNAPSSKTLSDKKMHSVDSEHTNIVVPIVKEKESNNVKLQNIGIEPTPEPPAEIITPVQPEPVKVVEVNNKVTKPLHKSESLREPNKKDSLHNSLSLEDARRSLQQSMALLTQAKNDYQQAKTTDDNNDKERQKQLKAAREIISNAIGDDNGKKVQRICMGGKPPVPYGSGGRSASGSLSLSSLGGSPPPTSPPHQPTAPTPSRTFRTEVQHRVDDVRNKFLPTSRGGSVERIIPIHFASDAPKVQNTSHTQHTQLPYQRNNTMPYRLSSVPRGTSVQSDIDKESQPSTPSTSSELPRVEPIKKSPREFIIPIAVEGVGYVTPRQGSLEPSETPTKMPSSNISFSSRFPKPRRLSSLVSGGESEDEDDMHMHRLRSSRRVRADAEKDSISSGEEDDDEGFELLTAENLFSTLLDRVRSLTNRLNGEEGTGFPQHHQSLFNNLHSPFFNSPHLPRKHTKHSVIRDGPSWRRSTSRDIASDFDSMFPSHTTFPRGSRRSSRKAAKTNDDHQTVPSVNNENNDNNNEAPSPAIAYSQTPQCLDLSDLDLSCIELSEKEVETLSGLTPGLSRRLQKQLLAQLPPAAARSLRRTLSAHLPNHTTHSPHKYTRSLSATKPLQDDSSQCTQYTQSDIQKANNNENTSLSQKSTNHDVDDESSISYSSARSFTEKEHKEYPYRYSRESSHSAYHKDDKCSNDLGITKSNSSTVTESVSLLSPNKRNQTPDRSVLGKYFSPEKILVEDYPLERSNYEYTSLLTEPSYIAAYGSNNNSSFTGIPLGGSLRRRSLKTPPADVCRRKVSRFLRPDFFDTPREESVYVRDKRNKEQETQKVLKEIRERKNRPIDLNSPDPTSPINYSDVTNLFDQPTSRYMYRNSLSPIGTPVRDISRSVTPFYPILDNIKEHHTDQVTDNSLREALIAIDKRLDASNKIHSDSQILTDNSIFEESTMDMKDDILLNDKHIKESRLARPKSFPTKAVEEILSNTPNTNINTDLTLPKSTEAAVKESKIIRPKSYPNTTTPSPEKQINQIKVNNNNLKSNIALKKVYDSTTGPANMSNNANATSNNQNITVNFNVSLPSKNSTKKQFKEINSNVSTPSLNHDGIKQINNHENISSYNLSNIKTDIEKTTCINDLPESKSRIKNIPNDIEVVECKSKDKIINNVKSENLIAINKAESKLDNDITINQINSLSENVQVKKLSSAETIIVDKSKSPEKNINENSLSIEKSYVDPEKAVPIEEKKKKSPVKKKIVVKKKVVAKKTETASEKEIKKEENATEVLNEEKKTKDLKTGEEKKTKDVKMGEDKSSLVKKKSVLHSLGEKLEKFKNESFYKSSSQEKEIINESKVKTPIQNKDETKVSRIENVMRALRERSVPNGNQSESITESGLIKRAVTVDDLPTLDTKGSQSKKAVNKVLGLFKKVESKENNIKLLPESVVEGSNSVDKNFTSDDKNNKLADTQIVECKPKRPTSLLLNGIGKRVQACYNGTSSENNLNHKKENSDAILNSQVNQIKQEEPKSQKKGLRLDFSRLPRLNQGIFNKRNSLDLSKSREGSECKEISKNVSNEVSRNNGKDFAQNPETPDITIDNSISTLDTNANFSFSSIATSPNWSPDYDASKFMVDSQPSIDSNQNLPQRNHEATSPDPDNIEDRIRRKSFYSRFNEKKNRRKSLLVGPGAKEYNPTERIHASAESDPSYYNNKYDFSPTSSKSERPPEYNRVHSDKECLSPTKYKPGCSFVGDSFSAYGHKSLDRNDRRYLLDSQYPVNLENNSQYSVPRYSRTVSLHDSNYNDSKLSTTDSKNNNSRYGRSFSLLSPHNYNTYSPRAHSRNSAILLRDDCDLEPYSTENVLTKIRNRKKLLAMSPTDDEDTYLDTKIRSNHTSNSEHDTSAEKIE